MEELPEIIKEFGQVFCGEKAVEYVKIRNTSKKTQIITVVPVDAEKIIYKRLRISPEQALARPGKSVRFTLTYLSFLEDVFDIIPYNIYECDNMVARLNVKATTLGPGFPSKTYHLKFFRLRNVTQTVKQIILENSNKCEAKFCFDLDEDYKQIQISQTRGVIPAKSNLTLKIIFNPTEPGTYYKTIFCLMQYHPPLIFKVLTVNEPKLKLEPKNLNIRYPLRTRLECNYAAYMDMLKIENIPEDEKVPFLQKCATERDRLSEPTAAEMEEETGMSAEDIEFYQLQSNINKGPAEVFLTTHFVNINNKPETLKVPTLVNFSKYQQYYFEWDRDPSCNFQIYPDRGVIEPNMKMYFNIYFSPSDPDMFYHTEINLRIYPCNDKWKVSPADVDVPLTHSLRILGNSFPDDSCGWIAQCSVFPKTLQLLSCVPGENVYGTFMIERRGHLPVLFSVVPSKDTNYLVQPPMGYLSRDFQLFVVEFNGKSKEEGVYAEDLKIIFNNNESNYEIIKLATSVETPNIIFGANNVHMFQAVFPGARTSDLIPIKNTTNLRLSYEFKAPEDLTWCEIVNPSGVIEPNSFSQVTLIFKPELPCEYVGTIPCSVSSVTKMDYVKTIDLVVMGSCQYGYLVATPSMYDYGECELLTKKSTKICLFNFSPVVINFQLTTVYRAFPVGDIENDVKITPDRGTVPGKSSLEVEVAVIPHGKDVFQYAILCQNLMDDSKNAEACEEPKKIFSFLFEGVMSSVKVVDLSLEGAGKLFSPSLMWKMLNINRINRCFASTKSENLVEVRFPDASLSSAPITVMLLLEANKYSDFTFTINKKITCPCFEASDVQIYTHCFHSRLESLAPVKKKIKGDDAYRLDVFFNAFRLSSGVEGVKPGLRANKRVMMDFTITYEEITPCYIEWVLKLPYQRTLILRSKTTTLPVCYKFSFVSLYLNPALHLKPVFIGDISPPLQLIWLYNNTKLPAAYDVVSVTLWGDNSDPQRIFECINPRGEIPPFSSLPLGFIFKPNELKQYFANVSLKVHETKIEIITLKGNGVANIVKYNEFPFEKTIPEEPILPQQFDDLQCMTNVIEIDYLRTFSKVKRLFLLKNKSNTLTFSFRWHIFKVENIIFAHIEPLEGQIEPGKKTLMTLIVESFSYSTSVSFSIPCDVINYSALKAHKEAVRLQEVMEKRVKDCFTITEKGTEYEKPVIEIPEKPKVHHIFITVNASIITNARVLTELRREQQCKLKATNEINAGLQGDAVLKTSAVKSILQVFEKSLWNIIYGENFWRQIEMCKNSNDFKYLQLLPESRRKRKQELSPSLLQRNYAQSLLENELKEIISKNYVCENNLSRGDSSPSIADYYKIKILP